LLQACPTGSLETVNFGNNAQNIRAPAVELCGTPCETGDNSPSRARSEIRRPGVEPLLSAEKLLSLGSPEKLLSLADNILSEKLRDIPPEGGVVASRNVRVRLIGDTCRRPPELFPGRGDDGRERVPGRGWFARAARATARRRATRHNSSRNPVCCVCCLCAMNSSAALPLQNTAQSTFFSLVTVGGPVVLCTCVKMLSFSSADTFRRRDIRGRGASPTPPPAAASKGAGTFKTNPGGSSGPEAARSAGDGVLPGLGEPVRLKFATC
jgi:hypothetical protein